MTDYWLSKLFFDSQKPEISGRLRENPEAVWREYNLSAERIDALRAKDVGALAPHVNAYLLRFYFAAIGMPDPEFIEKLRETADG